MTSPALSYLMANQAIDQLVADIGGNDDERASYMIMRAALRRIRASKGTAVAAEKAYALADEMVSS